MVRDDWRPFTKARKFVHSLKLKGLKEWYQYCKSGKKPDDIPTHPRDAYLNDGWIDWINWLGTGYSDQG